MTFKEVDYEQFAKTFGKQVKGNPLVAGIIKRKTGKTIDELIAEAEAEAKEQSAAYEEDAH